jgi:oligoribonuclease NrnB/cAMP/cGMP phosphodiesterase (DHH superfamily)
MKCFYHDDMDGRASAAIIKTENPQCKCIAIDYGTKFPFDKINHGEEVFIVDYSISPQEMDMLIQITTTPTERARPNKGPDWSPPKRITWIDHHQTAIDKYKDWHNYHKINYSLNTKYAACHGSIYTEIKNQYHEQLN